MGGNLYVSFWTKKFQMNPSLSSIRLVSKRKLLTTSVTKELEKKILNSQKLNGVGKESFAAMWIDHPFMIEGEKIRQQNILYFKAFLMVLFAICSYVLISSYLNIIRIK